jgi:hypothetical protein
MYKRLMHWSNYSLMTREDNNAKGDDILIGTIWNQRTQQHAAHGYKNKDERSFSISIMHELSLLNLNETGNGK